MRDNIRKLSKKSACCRVQEHLAAHGPILCVSNPVERDAEVSVPVVETISFMENPHG